MDVVHARATVTELVIGDATSPPAGGAAARRLAAVYRAALSTELDGQPAWLVFERWLWAFWCPELPPPPGRAPDAVSHHGAGGRGIQWFASPAEVIGHVPGSTGGYRVPGDAVPPHAGAILVGSLEGASS